MTWHGRHSSADRVVLIEALGSSSGRGAAVGWLAVALMLVPAGACTGGDSRPGADRSDESSSPSSGHKEPTEPVTTLAEAPPGARLDMDQLPRGEPPRVEYLDGTTMVLPDGTRIALRNQEVPPEYENEAPGRSYLGFTRFRSGWLTSTDSMGAILQLHNLDGSLRNSWVEAGSPVASSPGGRSALGSVSLRDGVLIDPDGAITRFRGEPVGFLGEDEIVINRDRAVAIGYPGQGYRVVTGVLAASATSESGRFLIASTKEHAGVFELPGADPILIVPGARPPPYGPRVALHGLSPDGSYLVATQRRPKPHTLVLASVSSGEVVVAAPGVDLEQGPYWEDRRHFLMVADDHILRAGTDGSIEMAAGPSRAGFVLPGADF